MTGIPSMAAARCQSPPVRPHCGPPLPPTGGQVEQPVAGVLLAGRYRLLEQVGRGATSTVWRARDERLDRDVAVKQVTPQLHGQAADRAGGAGRDPHPRAGLIEARIAARVRHPNVAAVHDVVEQGRSCWLVMDYLAARTLAAVLRERGPLSPGTVAALGLQLLAALRAVHRAGVVHCDVKPANLLVCDDGRLVLVDFGIAVARGADPVGRDRGEIVVGSPAYIAPELVGGQTPRPAADLWSLGATLYAAVEGRPPFPHRNRGATLAAVLADPPSPARLAGPLRPLLTRLLVKDPAGRPSHDAIHTLLSAVHPGAVAHPPPRSAGTTTDLDLSVDITEAWPAPAGWIPGAKRQDADGSSTTCPPSRPGGDRRMT